jgi:hypothetical protein
MSSCQNTFHLCLCYTPSLSHYSCFNHPNNIWYGGQIIKFCCVVFSTRLLKRQYYCYSILTWQCSYYFRVYSAKIYGDY